MYLELRMHLELRMRIVQAISLEQNHRASGEAREVSEEKEPAADIEAPSTPSVLLAADSSDVWSLDSQQSGSLSRGSSVGELTSCSMVSTDSADLNLQYGVLASYGRSALAEISIGTAALCRNAGQDRCSGRIFHELGCRAQEARRFAAQPGETCTIYITQSAFPRILPRGRRACIQ